MTIPYVVVSSPENMAQGVDLAAPVEAYFNVDLNPATVSAAKVLLLDLTNRQAVAGNVTYDQRKVTFTPSALLSPLTHYQLIVLGGEDGVKNVLGEPMPQSYKTEFTTGEGTAAAPTIIKPADRTVVSYPFTIEWTGGAAPYEVQVAVDAGFQVIYWPLNNDQVSVVYIDDGVLVVPDRQFEDGFYYVRVRSANGPWAAPVGFAVDSKAQEALSVPLSVVSVYPSPFAANVATNKVVLEFNQDLNQATVNANSVYIVKIPLG